MEKKIKSTVIGVLCVITAHLCSAQEPNFNQKAPSSGTFFAKLARSCFGGNTSNAKIIAVANQADWCSICQKNAEQGAAILPEYKTKPMAFVPNDLTDEHSKAISAKYLKKNKGLRCCGSN